MHYLSRLYKDPDSRILLTGYRLKAQTAGWRLSIDLSRPEEISSLSSPG